MAFFYKVILKNGTISEYTPKELINVNNLNGLCLFDYFYLVYCNNYDTFKECICHDLNIERSDIKEISIGKTTNDTYECSLIDNDNNYIKDVFTRDENGNLKYIKLKTVTKRIKTKTGKERIYQDRINVIMIDCPKFEEVMNKLVNALSTDSDRFLNTIYTRNNKFRDIMISYAASFKQKDVSLDDLYEFRNNEKELIEKLTYYDNYRSLTSALYRYDKNIRMVKKEEKRKIEIKKGPVLVEPTYNSNIDDYDKEYEEYLDENDNIEGMTDGENSLYIPKGIR